MGTYISDKISAGIDYSATVGLPAYSSGDWTLTLHLRGKDSIDLPLERDGSRHVLHVSGHDSSAWKPGRYAYSLRASSETSVKCIEEGSLTVLPNILDMPAGYDGRSPNRIALEAIEAVIANRATLDQQRYRINNRELWRTEISQLLKLRSHYAELVAREDAAAGGRPIMGMIKYRIRDGF